LPAVHPGWTWQQATTEISYHGELSAHSFGREYVDPCPQEVVILLPLSPLDLLRIREE